LRRYAIATADSFLSFDIIFHTLSLPIATYYFRRAVSKRAAAAHRGAATPLLRYAAASADFHFRRRHAAFAPPCCCLLFVMFSAPSRQLVQRHATLSDIIFALTTLNELTFILRHDFISFSISACHAVSLMRRCAGRLCCLPLPPLFSASFHMPAIYATPTAIELILR